MAESESNQSGSGPLSRIVFSAPGVALIVAMASVLLGTFRFQLARPGSSASTHESNPDLLERESRIWQDPFELISSDALRGDGPDGYAKLEEAASNNWSSISSELQKPANSTNAVLFVIDHPSPYPHGVESRLRTRTAVLSAMREVGLTKKKADQTDFVLLHTSIDRDTQPTNHRPHLPGSRKPLPYEIFRNDRIGPKTTPYGKVVVFWISERYLEENPWWTLHAVLKRLVTDNPQAPLTNLDVAILGPRTSDGLYNLTKDGSLPAKRMPDTSWEMLNRVQLLSATARAPDAFFPFRTNDVAQIRGPRSHAAKAIQDVFCRSSLLQYGATDECLCFALAAEMRLRGVDVTTNTVLLFSEYDTVYGRSLPLTFQAVVLALREKHFAYLSSTERAAKLLTMVHLAEDGGCYSREYLELLSAFENKLEVVNGTNTASAPSNVRCFNYLAGLDGTKSVADSPKPSESQKQQSLDSSIDQPAGEQQLDYIRRLAYSFRPTEKIEGQPFPDINDVKAVGLLGSDVFDKILMLQALKEELPNCLFFTTELDSCYTIPNQSKWTRNLITAAGFGLLPPSELMTNSSLRFTPFRDGSSTAQYLACVGFLSGSEHLPTALVTTYEIGRTVAHPLSWGAWHRFNLLNALLHPSQWWHIWHKTKEHARKSYVLAQNTLGSPALLAGIAICVLIGLSAVFSLQRNGHLSHALTLTGGGIMLVLFATLLLVLFNDGLEPIEILDGVSVLPSTVLTLLVYPVAFYGLLRNDRANLSGEVSRGLGFIVAIVVAIVLYVSISAIEIAGASSPVRSAHPGYFYVIIVGAWMISGILCTSSAFYWRYFHQRIGVLIARAQGPSAVSEPEFYAMVKEASAISHDVEEFGPLSYYPICCLLLLSIANSSLLDAWHWTTGLKFLSLSGVVILVVFPVLVQRRAVEFKSLLGLKLEEERLSATSSTSDPETPALRALSLEEKSLQNLNRGCFASVSQQPILGALAALVGGSGLITLLQDVVSR